jgi:hypothetical protein
MLSVSECLQSITQSTVDLAEILGYGPEINRCCYHWEAEHSFPEMKIKNTSESWINLGSTGIQWGQILQELWCLAVKCRGLLYSNPEVEQLLGQLHTVKSKSSNRMSSDSANAILAVRTGLHILGKYCTFEPPKCFWISYVWWLHTAKTVKIMIYGNATFKTYRPLFWIF